MDPFDPVLDRPETIDIEEVAEGALYPLANQDIRFDADAHANLHRLFWTWADAIYAQRVAIQITDLYDDDFTPMVTQSYPGYQETIYGTEGMIVSKRLVAPFKSHYDRAAMWLLDCQAEGDRLLRIDVEIDWGEPLTQRLVDGLLVAQRNPQGARGVYAQRNAESTRVFGNPQARPDHADLADPRRAHLVYHVLVNGMVEVSLLLTVSDVGEQMAWNGFLALRDSGIVFEKGVGAWQDALHRGRLWTPDPRVNRAVQVGRVLALRQLQRLRTGLAPADRHVVHVPALTAASDAFDIVQSRNLLAHLRRAAEKGDGSLPHLLPLRAKDPIPQPSADESLRANRAYLQALAEHLRHHPDGELLSQHYAAVSAVAERLIHIRIDEQEVDVTQLAAALRHAVWLAGMHGDSVNLARWQSEADLVGPSAAGRPHSPPELALPHGWELRDNGKWSYAEPWMGIGFAGHAVWGGCGVRRMGERTYVEPRWTEDWSWWALLNLPHGQEGSLSLVWDGAVLHANEPVVTELPLALHTRIQLLNAGEDNFDLTIHFLNEPDGEAYFRPEFLTA